MLRRLLLFTALCAAAFAQKKSVEKPPDRVAVDFAVTGPDGAFVPGLTGEDFEISRDGKRLRLAGTKLVANRPARTVVVVVDDLGLSLEGLLQVQRALRKFVAGQVRPDDRISFLLTGEHAGTLQPFTSDGAQLTAAIDAMHYNHVRDSAGPSLNGFLSGTLLQLRFTMDALRKAPERTAVVLFSERFMAPSGTGLDSLAEVELSTWRIADLANQAMAVLYAVRVQPSPGAAPPRTQTGLAAVVANTGGIWMDDGNDLSSALERVLADQSQHYLATFEPGEPAVDYSLGRDRSDYYPDIGVKVSKPGVQVRARTSVYAPPDPETQPFMPEESDVDEAASPFGGGAMTVRSTTLFYHAAPDGSYVEVMLHIDAKRLTFTRDPKGQYRSAIGVSSMAFGPTGQTTGEVARSLSYSLGESEYRDVLANGFLYAQRLPVGRAGGSQIRSLIRDEATGRVGSAGRYLEIPNVAGGEFAMSGLLIRPADTAGQSAGARERAAVRVFAPGSKVAYNYRIYHLSSDAQRRSHVETEIRLYRAGVQVFAGAPSTVSLDFSQQKTHMLTGTLGLGADMAPGRYVVVFITTDKASEKPRRVTQFIDLEVRR